VDVDVDTYGTRGSTNLLGLDGFKEVIIPNEKPRLINTSKRQTAPNE